MTFQCPICRLHYAEKAWAARCHDWCSKHDSCDLEVARHSVEAESERRRTTR